MPRRRRLVVYSLVVPLVATLALAATGCRDRTSAPAADNAATDAVLALHVHLELLQKLGVDGLRVDVDARGDQVHLSGDVHRKATAELAARVARQVRGVGSVTSDIRVTGEAAAPHDELDSALATAQRELDEAALATRVRLALVDRLGSDGFRVGIHAADGVVSLEFPPSIERSRRREAVRIAEALPGVSRVVPLDKN